MLVTFWSLGLPAGVLKCSFYLTITHIVKRLLTPADWLGECRTALFKNFGVPSPEMLPRAKGLGA